MVCVFVLTVSLNDVECHHSPARAVHRPVLGRGLLVTGPGGLGLAICVIVIGAGNLIGAGTVAASSWVFSLGASTVPRG